MNEFKKFDIEELASLISRNPNNQAILVDVLMGACITIIMLIIEGAYGFIFKIIPEMDLLAQLSIYLIRFILYFTIGLRLFPALIRVCFNVVEIFENKGKNLCLLF